MLQRGKAVSSSLIVIIGGLRPRDLVRSQEISNIAVQEIVDVSG
jgi:hypothetical protein